MENSVFSIIVSLITLTLLEVILGVDNLVFISVSSLSLPVHQQSLARRLGLIVALVTRLLLLAGVFLLVKLTKPLFTISQYSFSLRDLLLIGGGVFLLYKSTREIHNEIEADRAVETKQKAFARFGLVIIQIGIIDIVFSFDSVFTAVGLTPYFWVMATAITIAMITMVVASDLISRIIHTHPTIKMLALSFILLIGVMLIADGFQYHIPRGYIYFAISFSLLVELLNQLKR